LIDDFYVVPVCTNPFDRWNSFDGGDSPTAMVIGYFRNDTIADLAVLNRQEGQDSLDMYNINSESNRIDLFVNDGKGNFESEKVIDLPRRLTAAATCDFDGDTITDMIAVPYGSGTFNILLGQRDGTYLLGMEYFIEGWIKWTFCTDINGDGRMDVLIINGDNMFYPFIKDSFGVLQTPAFTKGNVYYIQDVISADLNNDKSMDTVSIHTDNRIFVYSNIINNSDSWSFGPATVYSLNSSANAGAAADVNSDKHLDLIIAKGDNTLNILLGDGTGTFRDPYTIKISKSLRKVLVQDFNNDGQVDLLGVEKESDVVILRFGNGRGNFSDVDVYPLNVKVSEGMILANDFNGDTISDLVMVSRVCGFAGCRAISSVFINYGNGTFRRTNEYAIPSLVEIALTGDFNGDKKLDLIFTGSFEPKLYMMLGNGDGTMRVRLRYATHTLTSFIAGVDHPVDNKTHLVWTLEAEGSIRMLFGTAFTSNSSLITYPTGDKPKSIVVNDFNGDGLQDLIVLNLKSDYGTLLFQTREGIFQNGTDVYVGQQPFLAVSGNFNGDKEMDIAVLNRGSKYVRILLGEGKGTFFMHGNYSIGSNPSSILSRDLNKDQILDIVVTNQNENTISILYGNGDGTFKTQVKYMVGKGPNTIIAGDFNHDTMIDLAVISRISSSFDVLFGDARQEFAIRKWISTPSPPTTALVYDFDQDGKLDMALLSQSSKRFYIYSNACP
jgi:hypothetical protein